MKEISRTYQPQIDHYPNRLVAAIINRDEYELLSSFDPFVFLCMFGLKIPDYMKDHPHRGFEAISYVVKGRLRHEDFLGNDDEIGAGEC